MQNKFLKNFAVILAVFFIVIVGQVILPSMGIFFFGQWLIFFFIFLVSFSEKSAFPLVVALIAGALVDFVSGIYFGIFTLSFFLVALIIKVAQQRLQSSSWVSFGVTLVICALCFFGLTHLFMYIFN